MSNKVSDMRYTFSREEIKTKFLSCVTNRSLSDGFDIFWAVLIYSRFTIQVLAKQDLFFKNFRQKALHMGYDAMIGSPAIHHGCFSKYCITRDHCYAVLIERTQFSGTEGYYPSTIESIDKWAPDDKEPIPYFRMYCDL